jgi:hypothetical protein
MKENIIYGIFGGLIGSLYMGWIFSPSPPKCQHACCRQACLATVDIQKLVSKKSQQLAATFVPETLASEARMPETRLSEALMLETPPPDTALSETRMRSIQEAGDRLKEGLKAFATTQNLILLAKGTVVEGDLPDKTEEILGLIEKGDF